MIEEFLIWAAALASHRSLLDESKKKADEPKPEIVKVDHPSCAAYFDQHQHRPSGPNPKLTVELRTISY